METKKSDKATLENYTKLFLQLGLVLSLLVVYILIEHKTEERSLNELAYNLASEDEIDDIPITERIEQIKPPPPPAAAPEKIEIVEDRSEIEEAVLESTEITEDQKIEVVEINQIEEVEEEEYVEEDVPFAIIEEVPIYPGCKGTKEQKKQCFKDKIREHASKKFNIGLAQELGLTSGVQRLFIQFKIDKTGSVSEIRVRAPHKRLEKEGVRVVQSLPKMIPGKQRGRPVSVNYTLPITFKVL